MEIYRNTTDATVKIDLPDEVILALANGGTIDVQAVANNQLLYDFPTVVPVAGGLQVTLPWILTRQDREFHLLWSLSYTQDGAPYNFTERSYVQVITLLLPLAEIAEIAGYDMNTTAGLNDTLDLERRVRHTIQSYTGQNFGMFYGVMAGRSGGSNRLNLPAPLLEFVGMSFDGIYRPNYAMEVINGGWALQAGNIEINSIKQAPPEWMLDRFDYVGKIHAPMVYSTHTFLENVEYKVEGLWGYHDVPANVRQAARLLTNDFACNESLWRDRYITNVQAADWRFTFDTQAFDGTGNVTADQLLSGYRRQTMAVV